MKKNLSSWVSTILFPVLFLVGPCIVFGQNVVVTYTETRKAETPLPADADPGIREMIKKAGIQTKELYCSTATSIYREKPKEMEESPAHMVVIRVGEDDKSVTFKNRMEMQIVQQIDFFGRSFLIREELKPVKWSLGTDQKYIGNYNCRKATATIDTMKITAWFCPDIPVNDGPDIFWGLPGLILEVDIDNGKRSIIAGSIKITGETLVIEVPKRGKEVSRQDYDAIRTEKLNEMRRTHFPGSPDKVEIRVVH